jgi:hypothetical protein
MALNCTTEFGSSTVAQHLFLGSSIVDFNSNTGWGGTASSLTVTVADDFGCFAWGESNARPDVQVIQIVDPASLSFRLTAGQYDPLNPNSQCRQPIEKHADYDVVNHYYNCINNDCYIDEFGLPYNPNRNLDSCSGPSKIKVVPGKVYHRCSSDSIDQHYWRLTDPGFFGNRTRIAPNGLLSTGEWRYNLIGIPVYFRFGYFTFGGIIESWDCNNRVGTPTYTIRISSADNLLKNCKVILSKFAGSVFTSFGSDSFGSPTNYSGKANHFNQTKYGNIPNVFNVYGFLESYGFGTSNHNDNGGIPLAHIIDSLCVLTSSSGRNTDKSEKEFDKVFPGYTAPTEKNKLGYHNAFSPFGRIIAPSLMTDDKLNPINAYFAYSGTDYGFGIIPPTKDQKGIPRVEFLLDLSEVPRPPLDVRYNGGDGHADILDIIREACQRTGRDFYTSVIRKDGKNYIKVKTVDRTVTVPSNSVEYAVRALEQSGLPVSQSSFGKEVNQDAKPRILYIGANQQRLFQTKSLLLGYSNTHLVYHPMLKKFVDYYRFGKSTPDDEAVQTNKGVVWKIDEKDKWVDSYKLPLAYSIRNLTLSNAVNSPIITRLFANEQELVDANSGVTFGGEGDIINDQNGFDQENMQANAEGDEGDAGVTAPSAREGSLIDPLKPDKGFIDKPVGGYAEPIIGNYWPAQNVKMDNANASDILVDDPNSEIYCGENLETESDEFRYIPLWHHAISPFFGYAYDQQINLGDTGRGSNLYRFTRPVYLDTWAGILVIGFRPNELPPLSLGLLPPLYKTRFVNPSNTTGSNTGIQGDKAPGGADENKADPKDTPKTPDPELVELDGNPPSASDGIDPTESINNPYRDPENTLSQIGFVVTETELRAAANGWESYLAYCLMKLPMNKPDLFIQLVSIYRSQGKLFLTAAAADAKLFGVGGMASHNAPGKADNQAGKDDPAKIANTPDPAYLQLNYNFNWVLNHEFIKDLQIIAEYLKGIHDEFYGKKYIVRLPEILKYRDQQYADIQIPIVSINDPDFGTQLLIDRITKILGTVASSISDAAKNPRSLLTALLKALRQEGLNVSEGAILSLITLAGISLPDYVAATPTFGSDCTQGNSDSSYDEKDIEPVAPKEKKQPINPETTIAVYQGSGKIFLNKELAEGAWEEPGNYIDDSILIGTPNFFKLCNENGTIPPLLGYNANLNKDYVTEAWCNLDGPRRQKALAQINQELADLAEEIAEADGGLGIGQNDIQKEKIKELKKQVAYRHKQLDQLSRYLPNCGDLMVPSLDLGPVSDPYVLVQVPDAGRQDPFGNRVIGRNTTVAFYKKPSDDPEATFYQPPTNEIIPIPTNKVYFPTTVDGDIIFLDPVNLLCPRAIMNAPGVDLYFTSMSYQEDPNLTVINNAVTEDYAILKKMQLQAVTDNQKKQLDSFVRILAKDMLWKTDQKPEGHKIKDIDTELTCADILEHIYNILLSRIIGLKPNDEADPNDASTYFVPTGNVDDFFLQDKKINVTQRHRLIAPRKAHPFYAAVPLKDNQNCYGPWTNYPWLLSLANYKVYPGVVNKNILIEQLINDVDLKINDDWAPWNYGGMSILDREILNQIESGASYQLVLENGTIGMPGMPLMSLSGGLQYKLTDSDVHQIKTNKFMGYQYHALLQCNANPYTGLILSTISTSVSDRNITTTYRFATYNPTLGMYSKEMSDRNKLILTNKIQLATRLSKTQRDLDKKIAQQIDRIIKNRGKNTSQKSDWKSDLFGNSPMQCLVGTAQYYIPNVGLPICGDPGLNSEEYKKLRESIGNSLKNESLYNMNIARTKSWIGGFMEREALAELSYGFSTKAAMSLDGIFSPISFFPTTDLGTYPISSRYVTPELEDDNVICPKCSNTKIVKYSRYFNGSEKVVDYPCPICNKPRLIFPTGSPENSGSPDINFLSLNPIVVPYGDFTNPRSQLSVNPLERSRHNIRIVGRQDSHQIGDIGLDTTNNLPLIQHSGNKNTNTELAEAGEDYNSLEFVNPDFYKYDLSFTSKEDKRILLNNRFFAFRGPMMLHGWGFDTDGYPVPNQADEPATFDNEGRPLRFRLTSSGTNDYNSDGAYLPTSDYGLGDIIGSGYKKEDGIWKRNPTNLFHLNWAERSDLWPIGPIDLRWDRNRKVWVGGEGGCGEVDPPFIITASNDTKTLAAYLSTASKDSGKKCPYKLVYVVLEEDMTKIDGIDETYPTRGFLDDSEYSLNVLPENTRKLIYIKDRCGYTAPRGAKILCRFDRETGYYEPITKQQYIVFGSMLGGNNAIADLTYIQGIKSADNIPKINIVFDNTRFNFTLTDKKRGMFMYENGSWILIGTS